MRYRWALATAAVTAVIVLTAVVAAQSPHSAESSGRLSWSVPVLVGDTIPLGPKVDLTRYFLLIGECLRGSRCGRRHPDLRRPCQRFRDLVEARSAGRGWLSALSCTSGDSCPAGSNDGYILVSAAPGSDHF